MSSKRIPRATRHDAVKSLLNLFGGTRQAYKQAQVLELECLKACDNTDDYTDRITMLGIRHALLIKANSTLDDNLITLAQHMASSTKPFSLLKCVDLLARINRGKGRKRKRGREPPSKEEPELKKR